jgi:putative ABC transport system ATP-binding protein
MFEKRGGWGTVSRLASYVLPFFEDQAVIELKDIWRTYQVGESKVHALQDVDLAIGEGDYLAVVGPSGSGKSTLLNVLGCLDRPTTGHYLFRGRAVDQMSETERTKLRQHDIGFVFQFFHLLGRLTAQANVELPMLFAGVTKGHRKERARAALDAVGLSDRAHHRPDQLSGGQRQRVAIARAVVMNPSMILADEPTGNLDRASALEVMDLLDRMNGDGQTIVLVTHDLDVADRARNRVRMDDGAIVERT